MKEFDPIKPQSEKTEIHARKQQEKSIAISNVSMHRGHTMFEINCSTGDIVPAKYEKVNATISGAVKKIIIIKENCLYVPCLNLKSAQKKFAKFILEQTKPVSGNHEQKIPTKKC